MEQQQPLLFNIQLNLDQINVILATMGKLPYETIAPLMGSIQAQANQQLQAMQEAVQPDQVANGQLQETAPHDTVVQ